MQIQTIHASHFLGCQAVDVRLHHRVHLFAGKNGAGKSSLRDAIALALTADLGRVSLKKEAAALIRDGSDLAVCEVVTADRDEYRVSINRSGKITDSRSGKGDTDPTLPYVLDAQRLARLTDTERRAFLFGLMGVKMGQAEIAERLKARGFDDARVQRVLPLLRTGFEAASKEAKAKATEAKGAWRTVTGEAYGSEKAKAWRAHVPAYDATAAAQLATELQHCDVAAEQWQRQVGALEAEEKRRAGLRAKLPGLQEHAAKLGRIADKLAADTISLDDWTADFEKTSAAAGAGPRLGLVHELARALTQLMANLTPDDAAAHVADWDRALDVLDAYAKEHGAVFSGASDPKAAARLPSVKNSRDLMASAVANDKRDLEAAKAAKTEADAITAELAETFDAAGLADAKERAAALKVTRAAIVQRQDALRSIKALVDAADAKTKGAAKHAEDVAAWDALGDALAPDGIPAEILSEALGPINERLAQSAADTTWPTPVIGADMAITAGGREYRLLSESEKWRTDAMLAEAVASLSGVRLMVLDKFDCLDLQGRADALGWLDVLADTGEIDTALLFGTLKALPASLPETIGCSWIESGVCGQLQEAA